MGLGRRKQVQVETKAARRIASLQTHELPPQVEHCLFVIGKAMVDHGRDGAPQHLDDALGAAEIAVEILRELRNRVLP